MEVDTQWQTAKMDSPTSVERYDRDELGPGQLVLIGWAAGAQQVLEFGPSTGFMSEVLRAAGSHVTAVEIDRAALQILEGRADVALWGDLETPSTLTQLEASGYDAILLADVLEHLRDPLAALELAGSWLKPGGRILVSMPNVAFWQVRRGLAQGHWNMTKTGILDETHLRFFTRVSAEKMFAAAGYEVNKFDYVWADVPFDSKISLRAPRLVPLKRRVNAAVRARFPAAMAFQYLWELREVDGRERPAAHGGASVAQDHVAGS